MTRWTASVEFWFDCPECGLRVLEGNPRKCPHQHGPKYLYNPQVHGPVENVEDILRQIGVGEPEPAAKPRKKKGLTTEEVVEASCPHGT